MLKLERFRQMLMQERAFYIERIRMIEESGMGLSQKEALQEDSTVDNHPADLGTEMFEREKDLGLLFNNKQRLAAVDLALAQMANGQYGICTDCGGLIGEDRLEAFPSATTCITCQKRREELPDPAPRPIEEEVLHPPFARTWRGDSGDPGYDGEDTWQDVARYGTSETPQDVPGAVRYSDMYQSNAEEEGLSRPISL